MVRFGVPGQNVDPLSYADSRLATVPVVNAPRRPTVTDKKFPMWCEWRVNKDAVAPATQGEFWKLVRFESNGDATWVMFSSGGVGSVVQFETDDSGTDYVLPNGIGVVKLAGGSGIDVTGSNTGTGNVITFALTGGGAAIDSVGVDFNTAPGTDPVVPNGSGNIDIIGNTVANATNLNAPIATHSRAANAFNIDVQLSTAIAVPADAFDVGLSSFNTAQFTVDSNGWVSIKGGAGAALQTVTGDDATAVGPDGSGNINFVGLAVANATNAKPLYFNGDAGTFTETAEIQVAAAITGAPGDKNDAGICSFDDTEFNVTADGYVTLINQPPFVWVEETTTTRALQVNQGVIGNNAGTITMTLPVSASVGQKMCFIQKGAGVITIAQNASQVIHFGNTDTTTGIGGTLTSTNQWDSLCMICTTTNNEWTVTDSIGSWIAV